MRKFSLPIGFMILAVIGFLTFAIGPAAYAGTTWKVQVAFPGPLWEGEMNKLSEMVENATDGKLKLKIYPAGSILKAPKILEGVAHKVADAGGCADIYFAGKIPEMYLMHGIPFLYDNVDQIIENVYTYKNGELFKLIQEAFKEQGNVRYLTFGLTSSNGLFGNIEVRSLEDLKGKKVRSTGIANGIINKLGGSPVTLPGSEHYTAFQRGTIDATIYPLRSIKDYRLSEVVKYIVWPPFYPGTEFGVICNTKSYDALPSDIKAVLDKTAIDWGRNVLTRDLQKIDAEYLAWIEKAGVKKMELPESDVDKLRRLVVEEILPPYVNKTPRCKQMWNLIEGYCKEKGLL